MLLKDIRFLVTQNQNRDVLQHVDVRIEDGRITEIGESLSNDDETVDCSEKVVMPGLVNTHTHAPMNVMRGISDNKVLQDWLAEDIFPAEERMDSETVYWGAKHAILEMVRTGTTCFNDMYFMEQSVADAVEDTGMRAVLAHGIIDMPDEEPVDTKKELADSKRFVARYQDHDRITPAVGPHAIYTCSEELLQQAKDQADKFDTRLHIHLSETMRENRECEEEHGRTPTAYLDKLNLLDDRFIGAHGVWLTENDVELLQETGAGIAHNPCSNLKLGSGVADIAQLREQDVVTGIATDSVASNNNLNMFEEGKTAALLQKRRDPHHMTEQDILDMLTIDGARLLNLDDEIGSIATGKCADITCIDINDVTLKPCHGVHGLLSNLVFGFHGQVSDTFVDGEPLLRDHEPQTVDVDNVFQETTRRAAPMTGEDRDKNRHDADGHDDHSGSEQSAF